MDLDDELENFIRERKARVAADEASLEEDPPYMEMKVKPFRSYGSTVKENIPPNFTAKGKEESNCMGLPLGMEYEKKKQRLQQELRMDYRRFVAQKNHIDCVEPGPRINLNNRRSVKPACHPHQSLSSQRVADTKRDDGNRDLRPLHLDGVEAFGSEQDEEEPSRLLRHRDRLEGQEGEEDFREDLMPVEVRRPRRREKKETSAGFIREGRRSRALNKNEAEEFATGLFIGTADTDEALQKKKERYRKELQAQIAEQHRNKKREKDLELKVAATGINDPEKQPDRIRQFGLNRRSGPPVLELLETGESGSSSLPQNERIGIRERYLPLPAHPHVAFQSPILEYNSALGLNAGGLSLNSRVPAPSLPSATDIQRYSTTQPDHIRQFGLSRRGGPPVLEPLKTGESGSSSLQNNERLWIRERDVLPPEQPHVAFQSPLLEYSSALGLDGGGLPPNSRPLAPSLPSAMDIPRNPWFPPHPPSSLSDAYRSPYGELLHYYGTRNALDSSMPYYGHLPVPGAGLPLSCWTVPPGGAVPSHFGNHSPHSQHSGSSFPEPPVQSNNETTTVDSQARVFTSERSSSTREKILSYRDALKKQIQEQQERRRLEREEEERYEAQLEADRKNHQPWGRGGGGAPLRDCAGNLITDLKQMHKLNEEAYSNPEQWHKRFTAAAMAHQAERLDPNERVSGFTRVQTPQFARGKVFSSQSTEQQLQEQIKYKADLKRQIEENMRKKAEERERIRLEEEQLEKEVAEYNAHMQRKYEEEQVRNKQKQMGPKAKNEASIVQLADQRKDEAERKKKEAEEKKEALRKQYEKERQARIEEVHRVPSPPIPTIQKRFGPQQCTPRPPTMDSKPSTVSHSECCISGLRSPPVPAHRNRLRAAGDHLDVFNELSALRRQLRSEQKRLEGHLQHGDWEELGSPLSGRYRERPAVDVFDMARLRLQAPVRRPISRNLEPSNLLRIHDSLQLKNTDDELKPNFREDPKVGGIGVSSRRRQHHGELYQHLSSQRSTVQDDYLDLSPLHQNHDRRSETSASTRGSLLESESFIVPLDDAASLPQTPEREKTCHPSARERRRRAKQSQLPQEQAVFSLPIRPQNEDYINTGDGLQQDPDLSDGLGSRNRTDHRDATTGPWDLSDEDSSTTPFSLSSLDHQSSAETVITDSWLQSETSDTLKHLERPLRRERLAT
ncbi:centrosome and spindle pole-associated protein 1-like isoform 2-T3 [Pholidichthys leucotaenia]